MDSLPTAAEAILASTASALSDSIKVVTDQIMASIRLGWTSVSIDSRRVDMCKPSLIEKGYRVNLPHEGKTLVLWNNDIDTQDTIPTAACARDMTNARLRAMSTEIVNDAITKASRDGFGPVYIDDEHVEQCKALLLKKGYRLDEPSATYEGKTRVSWNN